MKVLRKVLMESYKPKIIDGTALSNSIRLQLKDKISDLNEILDAKVYK
jgi:5,10-methylene-tetrahydrofolate dehydrogenase/methenyl tetrahydrofolate cyclohydrolase